MPGMHSLVYSVTPGEPCGMTGPPRSFRHRCPLTAECDALCNPVTLDDPASSPRPSHLTRYFVIHSLLRVPSHLDTDAPPDLFGLPPPGATYDTSATRAPNDAAPHQPPIHRPTNTLRNVELITRLPETKGNTSQETRATRVNHEGVFYQC
ncbi:hypothetical protein E2C01_032340 [Portunus trituberculatus]|uniref:Uncharacterized protein n=1 Tax=Portunus trituberculatus TaxID=210409 RepID=A0A5B7F2I8_PORTR|nr:hypothetical protein [Portunus trituberculatus]